MAYNDMEGYLKAYELVKAGLTSGSIKLAGSQTTDESAKRNAEADGLYIETLIAKIQASVTKAKT